MGRLFETVDVRGCRRATIRRRRYGVIQARDGLLHRVLLGPVPEDRVGSRGVLAGGWYHRLMPGDPSRLSFNQPRRFPNFLAVTSVVSARDTRWPRSTAWSRRSTKSLESRASTRCSASGQLAIIDGDHVPLGMGTALPVVLAPALHSSVPPARQPQELTTLLQDGCIAV